MINEGIYMSGENSSDWMSKFSEKHGSDYDKLSPEIKKEFETLLEIHNPGLLKIMKKQEEKLKQQSQSNFKDEEPGKNWMVDFVKERGVKNYEELTPRGRLEFENKLFETHKQRYEQEQTEQKAKGATKSSYVHTKKQPGISH
jgi:hypothetical protein